MAVRRIHDKSPDETAAELAAEREAEQRSLRSLLSELMNEVTTLFRKEVELAKAEASEKATQAKTGVMGLAAGGVFAFAGLIVLLMAAMFGLAEVMHIGWAALIVGLGAVVIGGIVAMIGMNALKPENLTPKRSVESLREDAEFAKEKANGRTQQR